MRAPAVVEFFGMPGAGKTYWHARIVGHLAQRGWDVTVDGLIAKHPSRFARGMVKLVYIGSELVRGAEPIRFAWPILHHSRTGGFGRVTRAILNLFYVRARIRRQTGRFDLLCQDQGLAQALWSIYWTNDLESGGQGSIGWEDMRADLPHDFVVVHVDVAKNVAGGRAKSRTSVSSPIDGYAQNPASLDMAWAITEKVRQRLTKAAAVDTRLRVVTIQVGENAQEEDLALQIVTSIENALQQFVSTRDE